ncbi:hypothetical protein [Xanthomonas citri]|uniref:hypothetical protein n=1 Tax=Xanthomonas citri TaxID=346 RepID=UPI001AFA35DB|nr:hypothetical protein [Xanthomonas citri]QRD62838.1 hypothetical protein H8Z74_23960 [Xanthomonas citri pv. citri]
MTKTVFSVPAIGLATLVIAAPVGKRLMLEGAVLLLQAERTGARIRSRLAMTRHAASVRSTKPVTALRSRPVWIGAEA